MALDLTIGKRHLFIEILFTDSIIINHGKFLLWDNI